jgi:hypothetical protein
MPAPHPPKAPPFVALPAQPKIPQPATSADTPSTATANLNQRQQCRGPGTSLACSRILSCTFTSFASIKHLTFVHELTVSVIWNERTHGSDSAQQFGILTFCIFAEECAKLSEVCRRCHRFGRKCRTHDDRGDRGDHQHSSSSLATRDLPQRAERNRNDGRADPHQRYHVQILANERNVAEEIAEQHEQ